MPTQTRRGRPKLALAPTTSSSAANQELADLAARMRLGQLCEGGCGHNAAWAAVAPEQTRFGCSEHVGFLLDTKYLWFLHPMGQAAAA